jgi:hypothetical protein
MQDFTSTLPAFLLILGATLTWTSASAAQTTTGVVESPHRLTLAFERGVSGFVAGDEENGYDDKGGYYGATGSYLYRTTPWLELGGRVGYGGTSYMVSDQLFLGGQARGSIAVGARKRLEFGLSLSTGLLALLVPDIPDANARSAPRNRYFVGAAANIAPDVRYWVTSSLALTFAGTYSLGTSTDLVKTKGLYLDDNGFSLAMGGQLGVVLGL